MAFGQMDNRMKKDLVRAIWPHRSAMGPMLPGGAIGATHTIDIESDKIARASYRWKGKEYTEEEQWLVDHVGEWLKEGIIEEAST
jgi:hypothetical protein